MSIHFHSLRIKEVRKETPDCVSVLLDVPDELKPSFSYTQGQNLTVKTSINGEEVRRSYSLCSSPLDNEWRIAIKKVSGGVFSTYANEQLKKGDLLEVMNPTGKFNTTLNASNKKQYLAIAAGSGITPILSIVKTTLATEPDSQFTIIYGNRTRSSIIFFEALQALKNRYMDRLSIFHVLSREKADTELNSGRVNWDKLISLSKLISFTSMNECFICGPEDMIFSTKAYLESIGIAKKNIHFELFNSTQSITKSTEQTAISSEKSTSITIKLDGRSVQFDLPSSSNTSILDAALQQGADLPYACKGGMCCTCKAKLIEGEVKMDVHWGLEDEEVEKGFILTCQSHPVSGKIVVDFDV